MSPEELLKEYTPLANRIAGGFFKRLPSSVLIDDIKAAAIMGLWEISKKYSLLSPQNFEAMATVRIRGSIIDELRRQDWITRRQRTSAKFITPPKIVSISSVDDFWGNGPKELHIQATQDSDLKDTIKEIKCEVIKLPVRERFVIEKRMEGMNMIDIAKIMKVTEPRICQIYARAIKRLRESTIHLR